MSAQNLSLTSRFVQFIRERFSPLTHLPMILAFSLGNVAVGSAALGEGVEPASGIGACLVTCLFFLRLRLFDELKDLDYDRMYNPDRPLVRGLVTTTELTAVLVLAVICEFALIVLVSPSSILTYALALAFSLLMYKEFFIGDLLRPHLTTYAVFHTFVSVLLGYAIVAVSVNISIVEFPSQLLAFGLINWALFNIFEFARKTFAPDEERPGVQSYSNTFSSLGAVALTASQMVIIATVALFALSSIITKTVILVQLTLMVFLVAGTLGYLVRGTNRSASLYRVLAGLYIVFVYIGFAFGNV